VYIYNRSRVQYFTGYYSLLSTDSRLDQYFPMMSRTIERD